MTKKDNAKEFTDRTVERAVTAACDYFNTSKENLKIEVITRGSTGLFGLGGRPAKISVNLKENGKKPVVNEEEKTAKTTAKTCDELHEKQNDQTLSEGVKGEEENSPQLDSEEISDSNNDIEKAVDSTEDENDKEKEVVVVTGKTSKPNPDEIAAFCEKARQITGEILSLMDLEGAVEVKDGNRGPYLDIAGEDLPLVIGKDGNTLNSLEFLVNLVAKQDNDIRYRIVIEAQGYREKRDNGLKVMAEKTAQKVKKTGKSLSLQPMSARERRVVHLALKDMQGIKTHSSGDGRFRKVVIVPLKRRNSKSNSRAKVGRKKQSTN